MLKNKLLFCVMHEYFFHLVLTTPNLEQPLEGSNLNEDYGYTVPSKPQNMSLQVANQTPVTGTLKKPYILDGVEVTGEGMEFFFECRI